MPEEGLSAWYTLFGLLILGRSADMLGLTTFEVKSSGRNKSMLTGLRNNIVTNQKMCSVDMRSQYRLNC